MGAPHITHNADDEHNRTSYKTKVTTKGEFIHGAQLMQAKLQFQARVPSIF